MALEVARQLSNSPVAQQLPTVGEALVQLDLQCSVLVHWIRKAVRNSVGSETTRLAAIFTLGLVANGLAKRVAVAVVNWIVEKRRIARTRNIVNVTGDRK